MRSLGILSHTLITIYVYIKKVTDHKVTEFQILPNKID